MLTELQLFEKDSFAFTPFIRKIYLKIYQNFFRNFPFRFHYEKNAFGWYKRTFHFMQFRKPFQFVFFSEKKVKHTMDVIMMLEPKDIELPSELFTVNYEPIPGWKKNISEEGICELARALNKPDCDFVFGKDNLVRMRGIAERNKINSKILPLFEKKEVNYYEFDFEFRIKEETVSELAALIIRTIRERLYERL